MKSLRTLILCLLALLPSLCAQAAWWEFGRQENEPAITELRFNALDAARLDDSMALGLEDLQNGQIIVRGRAEVRRGEIGLVEISLDEGKTWKPATLGEQGLFTWEFRPEVGRSYPFRIRAFSTTGVSTGAEEHDFHLLVAATDGNSAAREIFRKLLDAYQGKNRSGFMTLVSESFQGDISALDDALSSDFRFLDSIAIQANISRVVSNNGVFELYFTYNRQVRSSKSGQFLKDSAASVIGLRREAGGMKLVRMSAPLIFGVSDTGSVATSVTGQSVGQNVLSVDPVTGQASTQSQGNTASSGSATVESGSKTLGFGQSYNFDTDSIGGFQEGEITNEAGALMLRNGVRYQTLGGTLNSNTTAPATGYNNGPINNVTVGKVYALEIAPGPKYAIIEITSMTGQNFNISFGFRFKYQTNGSRNF